jgi:hypothetical protein
MADVTLERPAPRGGDGRDREDSLGSLPPVDPAAIRRRRPGDAPADEPSIVVPPLPVPPCS